MSRKKTRQKISKVRKGDDVIVLTGRDKGKKGSVLRVMPKESRIIVQGVNVAKRHTRQSATQTGGIVEKELSIHVSNVALTDPDGDRATRVGFKFLDDGRKVRYAKGSGEVID
jgi:large subunit ribosomal protein L24